MKRALNCSLNLSPPSPPRHPGVIFAPNDQEEKDSKGPKESIISKFIQGHSRPLAKQQLFFQGRGVPTLAQSQHWINVED